MSSRRAQQLTISAFTGLMYGYLLVNYLQRGALSVWTPWVVLGALYLADAGSGIAHFIVDYTPNAQGVGLKELFEYKGKRSGPKYVALRDRAMSQISAFHEVVFDFKVHHRSPAALGRRSVLKMSLPVIVFMTFPLTLGLVIAARAEWLSADVILFLLVLVGAATTAQYAHACAHKESVPRLVVGLQRAKLFISAAAHQAHHDQPDRRFCLLNGWANPLVDVIFQGLLKWGVYKPNGLDVT